MLYRNAAVGSYGEECVGRKFECLELHWIKTKSCEISNTAEEAVELVPLLYSIQMINL